MTRSDPPSELPLPSPTATGPVGPPPGYVVPPEHVPLDQPARTSPRTVGIHLAGLSTLGLGALIALGAGATVEDLLEVLVGAAVLSVRVVQWLFRTYTVTAGELVLDEGMLQKRHRVIPFSRIQQVELRQQVIPRVLGIAAIHIETAADDGGTAVALQYLDVRRAETLRDHLLAEQRRLRRGTEAPATPSGVESDARWDLVEQRTLLLLSPRQLITAGATSDAAVAASAVSLAAAALLAAVVARADDFSTLASLLLAVVAGSALAGTVVGLSAVQNLVQWWGFRLDSIGEDLQLSHGLLDRRVHTMPRTRLQHATIRDNPLRRALGIVAMQLHSAASPGRAEQQTNHITVPLVRRAQVESLLDSTMGARTWVPTSLSPRPPAARRRAILRRTIATTAFAVALAALAWPGGIVLLPIALLGVPWGALAHRRAGCALDGPVVAIASGVLAHRLELLPRARVQSVRTSSSPLQRWSALATLHLDVAGLSMPFGLGGIRLVDAAAGVADAARRDLFGVGPLPDGAPRHSASEG